MFGVECRCLDLETLTRVKRAAGRPQGSVPCCRCTNAVLILLLTFDNFNAAITAATVSKMTRKSIFTTRPFWRVL